MEGNSFWKNIGFGMDFGDRMEKKRESNIDRMAYMEITRENSKSLLWWNWFDETQNTKKSETINCKGYNIIISDKMKLKIGLWEFAGRNQNRFQIGWSLLNMDTNLLGSRVC